MNIDKRLLNALSAVLKLVDVGGEFLTKSERSGILGVSSANFDDVVELSALGIKHLCETL